MAVFCTSQIAFAKAACPAEAEQKLFDMMQSINQGKQTDLKVIADLVDWGIKTCPDRTDVQALATTIYGALMRSSGDLELVSRYAFQTQKAFEQHAYAWTAKHKPSVLKGPDGSPYTYFGNKEAAFAVTTIMPHILMALGEKGKIHPFIAGAKLKRCPYSSNFAFALSGEAKTWEKLTEGREGEPVFDWAASRLKSLRDACPSHAYDLNYYLSRHYGQLVYKLTSYTENKGETTMFGTSSSTYQLGANGQYYSGKEAFEKGRSIYLERARSHVKLFSEYVAAFRKSAEAQAIESAKETSYSQRKYLDDIRNSRLADAEKWASFTEGLGAP